MGDLIIQPVFPELTGEVRSLAHFCRHVGLLTSVFLALALYQLHEAFTLLIGHKHFNSSVYSYICSENKTKYTALIYF